MALLFLFSNLLLATASPIINSLAPIPRPVLDTLTPLPSFNHSISERAEGGGAGWIDLVLLIEELIDQHHNGYDTDSGLCTIQFMTVAGSGCRAAALCTTNGAVHDGNWFKDGNEMETDPLNPPGNRDWSQCFLNGVQVFDHEGSGHGKIGKFSIEFTQAGGVNSKEDGLHHPILKVDGIKGDINVQDISDQSGDYKLCRSWQIDDTMYWECGIPAIGSSYGSTTNTPAIVKGYAPGVCMAHVVHYQMPANGPHEYRIAAFIKDNKDQMIGILGDPFGTNLYDSAVPSSQMARFKSNLPQELWISTAQLQLDDKPLYFQYRDQKWDSNAQDQNKVPHCHVGGYDKGARQLDCWFSC